MNETKQVELNFLLLSNIGWKVEKLLFAVIINNNIAIVLSRENIKIKFTNTHTRTHIYI